MAKSDKTQRRAAVDHIRSQQKRADRRQGLVIVGACVVIALLIVGLAAFRPIKDWWDLREYKDLQLSKIGEPASVCGKVETKPASGTQEHVEPGVEVDYTDAPPAFGKHENQADPMERKLYTDSDRPEIEQLVHNLEHGYTILWYDQTVADDDEQMTQLRAIAEKLQGTDNWRKKFKAVPWTEEDGEAFPEGQHIAFTHWSRGGKDVEASDTAKQVGVWQYCSAPSGEALEDFMLKYPYLDSPEPNAA